jgi:hypothetical protein
MINHLARYKWDEFCARSRSHHIKPVQAHKEFTFTPNGILATYGERGDNHIPLLTLKTLHGIYHITNIRDGDTLGFFKYLLQLADDQSLLHSVSISSPPEIIE